MPRPKAILLTGILPAAAGILCGWCYSPTPETPAPALASPAVASHAVKPPSTQKIIAPENSIPLLTAPDDPKPPESVKDRLNKLAIHRRVEDLLAELEHLPPGTDRNLAIGLLAKHWFTFDHAGTNAWIAGLKNDKEKECAYCGLIAPWAQEDSESASIWVAGLPEGSLKQQTGLSLASALILRDPAASLSWALASRNSSFDAEHLDWAAAAVGQHDYDQAESILAASDLSED